MPYTSLDLTVRRSPLKLCILDLDTVYGLDDVLGAKVHDLLRDGDFDRDWGLAKLLQVEFQLAILVETPPHFRLLSWRVPLPITGMARATVSSCYLHIERLCRNARLGAMCAFP